MAHELTHHLPQIKHVGCFIKGDFINLHNNTKAKDIKRKKHFITFANNRCEESKIKAVMSAIYPGGFEKIKVHDLSSLSTVFRRCNDQILSHGRGSVYWSWKPYVILKTLLENTADGDILMYKDAGAYLIFIYITLILMNMVIGMFMRCFKL